MGQGYENLDGGSSSPGIMQQKGGCCLGFILGLIVLGIVLAIYIPLSQEDDNKKYQKEVDEYVASIQSRRIVTHLEALQKIADKNGGTRSVGTPGYEQSVDYVMSQLKKYADCAEITKQQFSILNWGLNEAPELGEVGASTVDFIFGDDFSIFTYSGGEGEDVIGEVVAPQGDQKGCDLSDWDSTGLDGKIAVVQRGDCGFVDKLTIAESQGAVGILIYNTGDSEDSMGVYGGTLGSPQNIPAYPITFSLGEQLITTQPPPNIRMRANTTTTEIITWNVLCPGKHGKKENTIVVGSHLDSVPAGPGINDNGSGSSLNLELAIQYGESSLETKNRIMFAWWGAEEIGLVGSTFFVNDAISTGDIDDIACNLNFDMIGSPNYFNGVYEGSDPPAEFSDITYGSAEIESLFTEYYDFDKIPYDFTPFDGRSDYGPFIGAGIAAGGLFTGAEKFKTVEERVSYGGLAEASYDTCYHRYCDTIDNIDVLAIQQNSEAAAYVTGMLAVNKNLQGLLYEDEPATILSKRKELAEAGGHLRAKDLKVGKLVR